MRTPRSHHTVFTTRVIAFHYFSHNKISCYIFWVKMLFKLIGKFSSTIFFCIMRICLISICNRTFNIILSSSPIICIRSCYALNCSSWLTWINNYIFFSTMPSVILNRITICFSSSINWTN
jgi:hypothetical protein